MNVPKKISILLAVLNFGYAAFSYANVNPIAPIHYRPSVQLRKLEHAFQVSRTKVYDESAYTYRTPLFLDRSDDNPPKFEFLSVKCGGEERAYLTYDTIDDVLLVDMFDENPIKSIKNPTIEQILHLMGNAPECKEK